MSVQIARKVSMPHLRDAQLHELHGAKRTEPCLIVLCLIGKQVRPLKVGRQGKRL